jgi:hypothetical protein
MIGREALLLVVLLDSDAAAGVDASVCGGAIVGRLLMIDLKPSEQAERPTLHGRTDISKVRGCSWLTAERITPCDGRVVEGSSAAAQAEDRVSPIATPVSATF